jgi:hypothetical protein
MAQKNDLKFRGEMLMEQIRGGEVIHKEVFKNGVTTEGLNKILDVMFHATAAITTWYVGLIDNAGYSAVAAADVMTSHAGWAEFTNFDEAARIAWTEGAAATGSITNATALTFTISDTGAVRGVFVCSDATMSGTSGVLWATALFSGSVSVQDNDQFKITYTVTAA